MVLRDRQTYYIVYIVYIVYMYLKKPVLTVQYCSTTVVYLWYLVPFYFYFSFLRVLRTDWLLAETLHMSRFEPIRSKKEARQTLHPQIQKQTDRQHRQTDSTDRQRKRGVCQTKNGAVRWLVEPKTCWCGVGGTFVWSFSRESKWREDIISSRDISPFFQNKIKIMEKINCYHGWPRHPRTRPYTHPTATPTGQRPTWI